MYNKIVIEDYYDLVIENLSSNWFLSDLMLLIESKKGSYFCLPRDRWDKEFAKLQTG